MEDFYGIPMIDEIWDAPSWQLQSLCIISFAILFQPQVFRKTKIRSFTFWVAIISVAYTTPDTTLIPILSTIIHTRSVYPYIIVIPHSFIAAATYRTKHGNVHYLQSLILAFFLYGFGGSIVSDLLMGLPVTALSHTRIIPCYVIGWSLVWFSPFDVMFRNYNNPSSSLRYFLQACEAVDSVTTPMGRISRAARELPNNLTTAPVMAGLLAGFGGAGIRHAVGESKSISVLEVGFWKTLSYSILWWWLAVRNCQDDGNYDFFVLGNNNCNTYSGSDLLRVIIVSAHTIWILLVGTGIVRGHPLVWLCREIILGKIGKLFVSFFRMGPPSKPIVNDVSNDEDGGSKKTNINRRDTIQWKKDK